MKTLISLSIFLFSFCNFYAQDYDLIVTAKGDSIACHIDSISDTHIYFEMRHNYNWIHTMFRNEQVAKYERNAIDKKIIIFKSGTSYIETKKKVIVKGYQHGHRLMFAPTSHSLKKGDLYYSTHYSLIHSLQYGFTDNISLDFGTTIVALPVYAMVNASFPFSNNFAFTVGNLVLFNIVEEPGILGNLTYGLVSIGNPEKNLNIGAGYMYFSDLFMEKTNTAAFTLSGQIKIGERTYLLTEHYGANVNSGFWQDYIGERLTDEEWELKWGEFYRQRDDYIFKQLFIGGMTGIRLVSNRNPLKSWQFGIVHILLIDDNEIPESLNIPDWDNHLDDGKVKFLPIPIISFSWKFGKNYK